MPAVPVRLRAHLVLRTAEGRVIDRVPVWSEPEGEGGRCLFVQDGGYMFEGTGIVERTTLDVAGYGEVPADGFVPFMSRMLHGEELGLSRHVTTGDTMDGFAFAWQAPVPA